MGSQPGTAIPICARAIEALAFGIKGVAAHADHAWVLGQKDDAAFALIHNTLAATANPSITLDGLMDLILECGRINLRAMEIPNQGHTESPLFPGAILMTTDCIQEPSASYLGNIFTTGLVAWPGVTHIARDDFTALIERPGSARLRRTPRQADPGRFRTQRHALRFRQAHRGGQAGRDQAFLPHRRVRRRQAGPQVLHRVRPEPPGTASS